MGSRKENLERELQQFIRQVEDDSTNTSPSQRCSTVLEAIHVFLTKWDALRLEGMDAKISGDRRRAKQIPELPRYYLRVVFCRMLSYLDPIANVCTVREQILSTLRSLETEECRQVVLDFLPAVTRIFTGSSSSTDTWNEEMSKGVKRQIISCLTHVFENEPNSLAQILQFFSSVSTGVLPMNKVIFPSDAFLFLLEILPKVPETNLHVAIRAIIHYVRNTEDARLAVDSVRTELALLEKSDIYDMGHVAMNFYEAVRGTKKCEELFVEEYFVVIEEFLNERNGTQYRLRHDDLRRVNNTEVQLLTFDLVMIMILRSSDVYRGRILRLISDGSLLESGLLSGAHLSRVVELINHNRFFVAETTTNLHQVESGTYLHFLESLIDLSMAILLTPLHSTVEFDTKKFFAKVHVLLVHIVVELEEDFQTKAILIILKTVEKLMTGSENERTENKSNDLCVRREDARIKVSLNIFRLLLSIVSKKREILKPFQNQLIDYITGESFDCIQNLDLLRALCVVVAKVLCSDNPNGQLESIIICRSLLFSSGRVDRTTMTVKTDTQKKSVRQIRGLVFVDAIISCCNLDASSLTTVRKIVSRVLLASHSNLHLLDPGIGQYGMKILRLLRDQSECDDSVEKELFQVSSLVLSHSKIVFYPEKQSITKPNNILAFGEMPSFPTFDVETMQRRKFRKMVFRFESFFANETAMTQPSSWEKFSLWIFETISTYLTLGRTAKWNPRAWIFAGIEISCVPISTLTSVRRKERLVNYVKTVLSSARRSCTSMSRMDKQIAELIKRTKSSAEKKVMVDFMSRFTLTTLFALSSSIAVLCNIYDHYRDILEATDDGIGCDQKREALQMVHYQFIKIYDLKMVCQSMERLFRNLGSNMLQKRSKKKRRLNETSSTIEKEGIQRKSELVTNCVRELLVNFLYSKRIIPSEALWICLTDTSHDALIISFVKSIQLNETIELISDVVKLRLNLIECLTTRATYDLSTEEDTAQIYDNENLSTFKHLLARCLRLTSFLLQESPFLKVATESNTLFENLTKLVSGYTRLFCTILVSKVDLGPTSETTKKDFSNIFGLSLSIFASKDPLNQSYDSRIIRDSLTVKDLDLLIASFRDYIGNFHTSITCHLLETLSVFSARSGSNILQRMVDVHWKATFLCKYMKYIKHRDNIGPPFVLVKLLNSLSCHNPQGHINSTSKGCCSHQTITKLMKARCDKSQDRQQFFVHSMCRHWGLLALLPRRMKLIDTFLYTLLQKLVKYLEDIDDCTGSLEVSSKGKQEISEEDDDDDDDEYIPPSTNVSLGYKHSIPASSDFSCLTSDSYPVYLDMLLRMTVSSIALFSIPEEILSFEKLAITSCRHHPVHKLERMLIVYGSLVELYKDKSQVFPKYLLYSIINISKCMLDVSVTKSNEYIEWRNCQPILPLKESSGNFDPASTIFLKKLLDAFGVNVVGTLRALCSERSAAAGMLDTKITPLRSLARKTERTFDFLCQSSNRYNTGEIKINNNVQYAEKHEKERPVEHCVLRREEVSSNERSTIRRDPSGGGVSEALRKEIKKTMDLSSIRKRGFDHNVLSPNVETHDRSYSEDEESFIDDDSGSSYSGSDTFGVSGDWGQNINDSGKERDSRFVIDRFQKSI